MVSLEQCLLVFVHVFMFMSSRCKYSSVLAIHLHLDASALTLSGTGLAPMLQMLDFIFDSTGLCQTRAALLYANRTVQDILFERQLNECVKAHPKRVRVTHFLSQVWLVPSLTLSPRHVFSLHAWISHLHAFILQPNAPCVAPYVEGRISARHLDETFVHKKFPRASLAAPSDTPRCRFLCLMLVCGPIEFSASAREFLRTIGFEDEQIIVF
jgi:ferredoxin-NADP reductase